MLLFLTGFMGCGKSYIGKQLAQKVDYQFIDLDAFIEAGEERTISEIFLTDGDTHFRHLERVYLHQLAQTQNTIIATGGGTPCFFDNMQWINQHGVSIYIKTPVALLAKRLEKEKEQRPLIANLNEGELDTFIQQKLEERSLFYEQAHILFNQENQDQNTAEQLYQYILQLNK